MNCIGRGAENMEWGWIRLASEAVATSGHVKAAALNQGRAGDPLNDQPFFNDQFLR